MILSVHDRIALELGRAIMRANGAEGQLEIERANSQSLSERLAAALADPSDAEQPEPSKDG